MCSVEMKEPLFTMQGKYYPLEWVKLCDTTNTPPFNTRTSPLVKFMPAAQSGDHSHPRPKGMNITLVRSRGVHTIF